MNHLPTYRPERESTLNPTASAVGSSIETYEQSLTRDTSTSGGEFVNTVTPWVPDEHGADWELVKHTPRLLATFQALPGDSKREIRPPVEEMIHGMTTFIMQYEETNGLRIQTMDELEEYCWYVAGTVGELITGLVTRDTPAELPSHVAEKAESFGLLLQLVNIAKDVATDYREENNVYVPETLLAEHGLEPGDIADPGNADAFAPVVEALVGEAETHIPGARAWLQLPIEQRGSTFTGAALPFFLAIGTLRELRSRPGAVIREGDVKISREEVFAVLNVLEQEPRPDVFELQSSIQSGPLHD